MMGHRISSLTTGEKRMDVKARITEDVRKLTNAASRLRIGTHKRKEKAVQSEKVAKAAKEQSATQPAPRIPPRHHQAVSGGLPERVVAATRAATEEKRWTFSELLHCLGAFVQSQCEHIHTIPSPSEVAMWIRCADRALQLNGWTASTFLMESHLVFTYMLVKSAFSDRETFCIRSLLDVKEVVLMSLYVSYTYNANEISYPLRPFLVKQDRADFWDKCTNLSLSSSGCMLKINRDCQYYNETLAALKSCRS